MRLFTNPAPGIGALQPGQFVVPQNPLTAARYQPRMGAILAANFTVPQNPILDAVRGGTIGKTKTGPGAAFRELSGLGCGCGCGGGGGCADQHSHDMQPWGPGLVALSGIRAKTTGSLGDINYDELGNTASSVWDQVTQFQVAGIPVVYIAGAFAAYQFLFAQRATGYKPSRVSAAKKRIKKIAAAAA